MASNLSVITATATGSASRSFNSPVPPEPRGAFAALLQTPAEAKTAADQPSALETLGSASGEENQKPDDPNVLAAAIDATAPIQTTPQTAPALADLVSNLADLRLSLEAGKTPDPALLDKIGTALDQLAQALGVSLDALPSLDELKAMTAKLDADNSTIEAKLTAALGAFATDLASEQAGTADGQLKAIADKLGALLKAINAGEIAPDRLAELGLGASADADLEAALAKLQAAAPKIDASANAQLLATPSLKLNDTALVKAASDAEASPAADKIAETSEPKTAIKSIAKDADAADTRPDRDDRQPADQHKLASRHAVATPLANDKAPEPQASVHVAAATSQIDAVAAPRVLQTGYQTSQQQLNLPQIAFELARQTADGNTRFQIRLDPAELGKIDVRLDIDVSGRVTARLTVEKPETLDLMQRDQKGLERALQQAGLDGAKTNLEFSLKQNPFAGGQQQGRDGRGQQFANNDAAADAEVTPPPTISLYRGSLSASGVNILA